MFSSHIEKIFELNKNKVALVKDTEITYREVLDSYKKWKNILEEKKIPNGSVFSVRGDYSIDSIGLMLALIKINCIYVPLANTVKDVRDKLRIAEVEFFYDFETNKFEDLNTQTSHEILVGLKRSMNPGLILFSSGTTGEPKASVHNFSPMLNKYLDGGKAINSIAFLLFDHIGGVNTLLYTLANGGTLVLPQNRNPSYISKLIQDYKIEVLPTSPTFINMLLVSKAFSQYDLSSLKVVTYGTEPMPQSTLNSFVNVFPNVKMKQTYGLSEVGILRTRSKSNNSLWIEILEDSHHSFKVVDDIIFIKSSMAMLGYLNAPSPFDENGWFNTQDKVLKDGNFYKILGRISEIINVGGEKVYPSEVESVILSLDEVRDAIVFSKENSLVGNVVACKVQIDDINSQKEIKSKIKILCKEKLEKFKRPVYIEFTDSGFSGDRFKRKR
ncbi:AMP-binding enzyme [Bacteriovorax sp. BAL6_X]|uniref:ANL family adenylate-forming protein n=1 Tax=Bacteriovorax sp. BAL6_X TaxID=1201290 RepID=UPI0003854584|nr:fatty acid--CoA ligase family protein [Bacteriovorax sp. BAL6_X]EPZ50405.1 AMP-binding enzyme [Bacteriovorax sp. BAL6_X]